MDFFCGFDSWSRDFFAGSLFKLLPFRHAVCKIYCMKNTRCPRLMLLLPAFLVTNSLNCLASPEGFSSKVDCMSLSDSQLAEVFKNWSLENFYEQIAYCTGLADVYNRLEKDEKDTLRFLELQGNEASATNAMLLFEFASDEESGPIALRFCLKGRRKSAGLSFF